MPQPVSLLMVQFLSWVADRPRSYADVMDAWRSNCPRQSVWEDAIIDDLVRFADGTRRSVELTPKGRAALAAAAEPDPAPAASRKGRAAALASVR